jgi:DNA-binding NarL/FixJ family response regulator
VAAVSSALLNQRSVRILIADDHRLFAESLMSALSEDDRVDVVGLAGNGQEAVDLGLELQPDVILMDLRMPMLDGFEATRRLREGGSEAQVLILTGADEAVGSEDAARAGATGYLRKEQSLTELKDVFLEVASLAAALSGAGRYGESQPPKLPRRYAEGRPGV